MWLILSLGYSPACESLTSWLTLWMCRPCLGNGHAFRVSCFTIKQHFGVTCLDHGCDGNKAAQKGSSSRPSRVCLRVNISDWHTWLQNTPAFSRDRWSQTDNIICKQQIQCAHTEHVTNKTCELWDATLMVSQRHLIILTMNIRIHMNVCVNIILWLWAHHAVLLNVSRPMDTQDQTSFVGTGLLSRWVSLMTQIR